MQVYSWCLHLRMPYSFDSLKMHVGLTHTHIKTLLLRAPAALDRRRYPEPSSRDRSCALGDASSPWNVVPLHVLSPLATRSWENRRLWSAPCGDITWYDSTVVYSCRIHTCSMYRFESSEIHVALTHTNATSRLHFSSIAFAISTHTNYQDVTTKNTSMRPIISLLAYKRQHIRGHLRLVK